MTDKEKISSLFIDCNISGNVAVPRRKQCHASCSSSSCGVLLYNGFRALHSLPIYPIFRNSLQFTKAPRCRRLSVCHSRKLTLFHFAADYTSTLVTPPSGGATGALEFVASSSWRSAVPSIGIYRVVTSNIIHLLYVNALL